MVAGMPFLRKVSNCRKPGNIKDFQALGKVDCAYKVVATPVIPLNRVDSELNTGYNNKYKTR